MDKKIKKKTKKSQPTNIFAGLKNGGPELFGITLEKYREMEEKSPQMSSVLKMGKKQEK